MGSVYTPGGDFGMKRDYVTCSVFCTVLQIQLDHVDERDVDLEMRLKRVSDAFSKQVWGGTALVVQQLNTATLKRAVRCQVCGTSVKPSA
jgi:hypothetical protein